MGWVESKSRVCVAVLSVACVAHVLATAQMRVCLTGMRGTLAPSAV
jgi:hypothetical protein